MNYKIFFQERAKLATEMLSKQSSITLEDAKKQGFIYARKCAATQQHLRELGTLKSVFLCINN